MSPDIISKNSPLNSKRKFLRCSGSTYKISTVRHQYGKREDVYAAKDGKMVNEKNYKNIFTD